ncbi:spermidine/putrescine ABC transporter substrate-binding protein [Terrabacter aerolatus]|uniref:Polyamine-binding lipoprotein n=1 Tax=Terrabacter aerolatus TaxID=422442 RepID=A0A512CXJ6_9MICO|nr:spermidine/putrescine ABC transporter substrate-binding protein [Terrabacter aerolatus]GEO28934.1 polyamine-binding lipoprotein [Terrabacter aerolatus]
MNSRRPPSDPGIRSLISLAASSGLSRRGLLGGGAAGLAALGLSACAPPAPPSSAGGAPVLQLPKDVSDTEKIVKFANWTAYLDYDDKTKTYPTLEAFQKKTGITVTYSEDIEDNDSYETKIEPQLQAKQDIDRDIFVFTDWMANRMIQRGFVQPLELIRMRNAANIRPILQDVSFDPGRNHSLTWQSGFAGIGYHKGKVGRELKTLDDLFAPDLKGKITALSEFRDTVGLIMLWQGVDISQSFTEAQFQKAVDEVTKQVSDGQIRRIKGNSYLQDLTSGNAIAGIVWSGDIAQLQSNTKDDNWTFVMPESKGTLWSDNMMVPITSRHRRNAQKLMDYYYDPLVAAKVAAYVAYICPVEGAQDQMKKVDPTLVDDPMIFPTEEYLRKETRSFRALSPAEDQKFSQIWSKAVGN